MSIDVESLAIAAGLVVVALVGLVVAWKLTKSLFTLAFWLAAALVIAAFAWWLLAKQGIVPPLPAV